MHKRSTYTINVVSHHSFSGCAYPSSDVNKTKFLRPRPPEVNKGNWRI